jgi:hypothetical protein
MDDAIRIVVTSLADRPSFYVSDQVQPRAEFVVRMIEYLFQETDATWEFARNEPLKEKAAAA